MYEGYELIAKELTKTRQHVKFLNELSYCFMQTGNTIVAKNLRNLTEELTININFIDHIRVRWMNECINNAEQSSKNMLNAMVAGIKLSEKDNEGP